MCVYVEVAENIFRAHDLPRLNQSIYFPPGYPLWLFLTWQLLHIGLVNPVLYLQAIVGGLAVIPLIAATRNLYSDKAGFVAGIFYALYIPYVYSSSLLMSEALAIPLLCVVLWSCVRAALHPNSVWAAVSGLLLAAATHVRTNVLLIAIPLVLILLVDTNRLSRTSRLKNALLFVVVLALSITPWCIRSSIISGRPAFLAANSGQNLYQGNNPLARPPWTEFSAGADIYKKFEPTGKTYVDADAQYRQVAIAFIKHYWSYELFYLLPERIIALMQSSRDQLWPWNTEAMGGTLDYPFGPYLFLPLCDMPLVYCLGLFGLFIRPRTRSWLLPGLWVASLIPILIVPACLRYRFPADLFVMPLAGAAVACILDASQWRCAGKYIALAYAAVCIVGSAINVARFSGPDWLSRPAVTKTLSPAGDVLHAGFVVCKAPVTELLYEVRTRPATAPHLYLSYNYRVEPVDTREFLGPDIRYDFLNDAGTTITIPTRGGSVLSPRHRLNRFQDKMGTAWHLITVPALATRMVLTLTNDVQGTATVGRIRLRGPIWERP
jgi:hypothetical protein